MGSVFETVEHSVDLCVVGGGMSGYGAALAAANHGVKVLLMHDRSVLGGNASSEVKMHICGADTHNSNANLRETGLMEELRLKNVYHNPEESYSRWDVLLYEDIRFHPNITLLLNCSCLDAEMKDGRVVSVTGWQIQSELYHRVEAKWFSDCSGDGILAPLTGAEFRIGCEAKSEYDEALAPDEANDDTMGQTLMFSVKDCGKPVRFIAPEWANEYLSCDDLPQGLKGHGHGWFNGKVGYWWIELGGKNDTIHENEYLRDELLKVVYGVWDHLKNHCERKAALDNFAIDWVASLPAKRESRRYIGGYVLNENDLETGRQFEDNIAYGGWSMDNHDPAGFHAVRSGRAATHFHKCQPGYGIPWRCLYSKNVPNLLFAGRNASMSHMAMSSTRVMATCLIMGQAVGTAVGVMKKNKLQNPSEVGGCIKELQQTLLLDDAYIPAIPMAIPEFCKEGKLYEESGNIPVSSIEAVRDGFSRQVGDVAHGVRINEGDRIVYEFATPVKADKIFVAFDSQLNIDIAFSAVSDRVNVMPKALPREFEIEVKVGGKWESVLEKSENYNRHYLLELDREIEGARLNINKFWGNSETNMLYSFVIL